MTQPKLKYFLRLTWAMGATAATLSPPAQGNEYQPALGKGVNFSETKTFGSCVQGIATESEAPNPSLSRLYNESRIENRRQLEKSMDISASMSAKGLWGSASGSASSFNSLSISSTAFYWLVDAKYELSSETIKTNASNFDLTPNAKEILKKYGIEAFYQACGTHFYTGRKIGARYSLVYEFKSEDDRSVDVMKATASYGGYGVSASGSFQSTLNDATQNKSLTVHSSIVGGDDTLQDYATNPEQLKQELSKLRAQLYREGKGEVIQWYMTGYDQFPDVAAAKAKSRQNFLMDSFRNNSLALYYGLYMRNNEKIDELTVRMLKTLGDEPYYVYSATKLKQLQDAAETLARQNELVQTRAIECIHKDRGEVCKTSDLHDLNPAVPDPDKDLSGLSTWTFQPEFHPTGGGFSSFDLMGEPEGNFQTRIFLVAERLFSSPDAAAYVLAKAPNGIEGQMRIGSIDSVVDPKTGKRRPAICVGDFAKVCGIRVIENSKVRMEDGYPVSRVQLTLFNERGYVYRRFEFLLIK